MRRADAKGLVAALVAGYPTARVEQATVELYTTQIAKLSSLEAGTAAVEALLGSSAWFPSFAAFREAYGREARRMADEREAARRRNADEFGLEAGPRPPIPEDVLAFAASLSTGSSDRGDPLAEYEIVGPGPCADCLRECEVRVRYGTLDLCYAHALSRLRVSRTVSA